MLGHVDVVYVDVVVLTVILASSKYTRTNARLAEREGFPT